MADAATIASLATAGGTLVLAIATFSATRSANHSARVAERALDLNLRPVLIPAHEWEPTERITFHDQIFELRSGFAAVQERDGNLYFAAQLRNVGAGIGVLTSWKLKADPSVPGQTDLSRPPDPTHFVAQQRSLYVPPGDVGYWQGAIREGVTNRGDADALRRAIEAGGLLTLFLRYADLDGGHDTITRYSITPDDKGDWKRDSFVSQTDGVTVQYLPAPTGQKLDVKLGLSIDLLDALLPPNAKRIEDRGDAAGRELTVE